MTENEVGCIITNNYVENISYDLPNKWAQITYLVSKELQMFKQMVYNPINEKSLGFEIINEIINCGGKFLVASPKNMKVNDVDDSKDVLIAQKII
jgi:hypothetical protein